MAKTINTSGSGWLFALAVIMSISACSTVLDRDQSEEKRIVAAGVAVYFIVVWIVGWYKPLAAALAALLVYGGVFLLWVSFGNPNIIALGIQGFIVWNLVKAVQEGWDIRKGRIR